MNKTKYLDKCIRYIGGKQPVSNAKWVIYRTFYVEQGVKHISHIHAPMRAGELSWRLDLPLGNIHDFCVVNAPKFRFKSNKL